MKKFLLLFYFLAFVVSYAQDLPNYLTNEEKELLKSYYPPSYSKGFITPPIKSVRTMAEWEELQGILITWTSQTSILRQIVDYAQDEGLVYIVCSDSNSVKNYLTSGGVPHTNLRFIIASYNSIWCRDYGPWTVYSDNVDSLYIIDWIYNRPRPQDDLIPAVFANKYGYPLYQTTTTPNNFINTGGNFMTDGFGTGFASKLVLTENSGKTEAEINNIMNKFMGINKFIKMQTLPYDEIHHIDMHMKLLDEETILVGQYPQGIADGPQIEANLQYILNNYQTCYGRPYKVVRIPMPPQNNLYPNNGGDYRTYTNSLIINKTIIVPTYETYYDTTALRIYRQAMPGYNVVGINCNSIIPSLGAIHCITKEIGANNPILISHAKIDENYLTNNGYFVGAKVLSKIPLTSVNLYFKTNINSEYQS
ncbi:MAG TPA: agmatine deiminase family protein, partial [Melioribacteraceae bacterium]|nr:agmatine deiminase family protein [Melioribacteraceae bacterium]